MPDKADHGLRHFIEAGVDQVRQSSASSFEAMPVEPTRSQNMTVSGGLHERWLRGPAATSTDCRDLPSPARALSLISSFKDGLRIFLHAQVKPPRSNEGYCHAPA